jgi:hypothetical protein
MQGRAGWGGCISSSWVVVAMLASCSSCGSMGGCRDSCYRDNGHLPSVRACSGPTDPTHGAGRPHCPNSWCRAETIWCRADARDHLRLRGAKGCRRTQPAKFSEQCSTKRYQADCAPMPFLIGIHWDKRLHDPLRGLSRTEYVKLPGSYWAFGQGLADRTPNITVRRDRLYQDAHLKSPAMRFHHNTMEPLHPNRIFGDTDPWHVLRWGASCGPFACSNLPRLLLRGGGGSTRPHTPSMVVSALCLMFTLFVGK